MQSILTGRAIGADTVSLPVDGLRTIHGHAGKSYTVSGRRHTVFFAGGGAETCNGAAETGKLTLFAGTKAGASDVLIGGSHNNAFEMDGGAAAATLVGGAGKNYFVFDNVGPSTLTVEITNFAKGDHIELGNFAANAVKETLATQVMSSGVTTITLPDGTQVAFSGAPTLTAKDFIK
jgi:Ca2+-binding RTX toxin-like protein